jgi:prophage antirepressor-like protein
VSQDITPFIPAPDEVPQVVQDGEVFYNLVKICAKLGISASGAWNWARKLPKEYILVEEALDSRGVKHKSTYINQDGILEILRRSSKPTPREWQGWLGTNVAKEIVEDGSFIVPDATIEQLDRAVEKAEYGILRHMLAQATDYDPNSMIAQRFFGRMRNAFYLVITGYDAKQIVCEREGEIVSFKGKKPTKTELGIAANYLVKDELELLKLHITHSIAQTRIQFFQKEYTMRDFVRSIESGLSKFWEK